MRYYFARTRSELEWLWCPRVCVQQMDDITSSVIAELPWRRLLPCCALHAAMYLWRYSCMRELPIMHSLMPIMYTRTVGLDLVKLAFFLYGDTGDFF